uniref:Soluble scavenger receptor cysteine-rich domain-containing protein SSC5D n=1 Tax=Salarias fasciatus TaxID=181472 RepID=A0A672FWI1_SALFA
DYVMQYPGRGLGDHSFCRNPDRESNPWCFFRQNSGAIGWAYCDCHQGVARLVGSSSSGSGRVEVYLNGQWGAVCNSHWTDRDASVICRQLGLGEIGTALQHSEFGSGSGLFHYERLGCRGDENTLSKCRSRTFVTGDCSHGNEAAVVCSGPPLRLVGGEEDFEGRLEVFHAGRWGSVCDDQWDDRDAEVVCRQLGFGGVAKAWSWAHFGQGSGPILLDAVKCSGNELFLDQCPHGDWEQHNCDHMEDAGVSCSPYTGSQHTHTHTQTCSQPLRSAIYSARASINHYFMKQQHPVCDGLKEDLQEPRTNTSNHETTSPLIQYSDWVSDGVVRLVGGDSPWEGRVEVFHNGDWGTVCDDHWSQQHAEVVCRQLGYRGHAEVVSGGAFGEGVGLILLDDVQCDGSETSLLDCRHGIWGRTDCSHSEDVGVRCRARPGQETNEPRESSCGLRKMVEAEGKRRSQGEENMLRTLWLSCSGARAGKSSASLSIGSSDHAGLTPPPSRSAARRFGSDPSRYMVRVGASERTLTPERLVVHRKFKGQSGGHDLALLKLPSAKGHCVTFDPDTNAACLPSADTTCCHYFVFGATLWRISVTPNAAIASWVPVMSSWQCKKRYGDSFSSHGTLCAGSPPDTSLLYGDGCGGNSGGGLVCQEPQSGRWSLAGVVAGGYGCADPSSPALYTRVSRFRAWIDESETKLAGKRLAVS